MSPNPHSSGDARGDEGLAGGGIRDHVDGGAVDGGEDVGAEDFGRRALGDHLTAIEEGEAIAGCARQREVMEHQQGAASVAGLAAQRR